MTTNNKTKKVKVRGSGVFDPTNNSFEFQPFNDGPSSQTKVRNCKGGGKSWETTGADPSKMLSLKCKVSEADPYAELARQFEALTRDLRPKRPVALPKEQRVVSEDGLECWVDTEKHVMTFTGTVDLSRHPRDWQAEVLRHVQLVVRRLPASEKFNKMMNQIKNGGNKQ